MKRFLVSTLSLLLAFWPALVSADSFVPAAEQTVVGPTTITNAQIVGVATLATGAFIHSFAGATLANYLGHKIRLCDASTPVHCATGFIKAAGTAEQLTAINNDPGFDTDASWTKDTVGWAVAGSAATATTIANGVSIYRNLGNQSGKVVKAVAVSSAVTSGKFQLLIGGTISPDITAATTTTTYRTATANTNYGIKAASVTPTSSGVFESYSVSTTDAPSATGVTISSTKGGATQSWSATETGFNPNSATFTFTITKVWAAPIVAGAAIVATAVHVQTISPALVWLDAIDLSPYASTATNSFYLCLYDSSNRTLCAYAGAAGAGEALAADTVAGWNLTSGWANVNATINDANTFTTTFSNGHVSKTYLTAETLYKFGFDSAQTGGTTQLTSSNVNNVYTTDGTSPVYKTAYDATIKILNNTGGIVVDVNTFTAEQVTAGPATGLDLRSTGKLGGTQVPVFTTTGFDGNAVTRWSILYIGG